MTEAELLIENKALREIVQSLTNKIEAIEDYIEMYESK